MSRLLCDSERQIVRKKGPLAKRYGLNNNPAKMDFSFHFSSEENTRRVGARSARGGTIRRELALHGRVCKYAALSALRAKARFVMPRPRSPSSYRRGSGLRGRLMAARELAPSPEMQDAKMFLSRNTSFLYCVNAIFCRYLKFQLIQCLAGDD